MDRSAWRILGIAFLISATLLRLEALDAPFSSREAVTLELATQPVGDLLRDVGETVSYPPAYFLVLHAWTGVFGTSEVSVRGLSLLFTVLMGFVLLWWLRRAYSGWTAAMTMLMVGISTFHLRTSMEAQPSSMFTLVVVLWFWCYHRYTQDSEARWKTILPLAATQWMLVGTDFHSSILLSLSGIHFLLFDRRTPVQTRRFGFSMAATIALSAAWFPVFLAHAQTPAAMLEPIDSNTWRSAILALGPAPVHVSDMVAWGSAVVCVVLALQTVVREAIGSLGPASNALAPGAIPLAPWRGALATGLTLAALTGPLLAYLIAPWSAEFREDLDAQLLRAVALSGIFFFSLLFLIFLNANRVRKAIAIRLEDLVAVALGLYYAITYSADVLHDFTKLAFAIPILCLLIVRSYVPTRLSTFLAILALIVATAAPSLMRSRSEFLPTPDFRSVANAIRLTAPREGTAWTFILPMWDERGLEHYLGGDSVTGILAVDHMGPVERLPQRVNLVLTRKDFEDRGTQIALAARYLGPGFAQSGLKTSENIFLVSFDRIPETLPLHRQAPLSEVTRRQRDIHDDGGAVEGQKAGGE